MVVTLCQPPNGCSRHRSQNKTARVGTLGHASPLPLHATCLPTKHTTPHPTLAHRQELDSTQGGKGGPHQRRPSLALYGGPLYLHLRRSILSCQPASAAEHLQSQTHACDSLKQERANTYPHQAARGIKHLQGRSAGGGKHLSSVQKPARGRGGRESQGVRGKAQALRR